MFFLLNPIDPFQSQSERIKKIEPLFGHVMD